MGELRFRREEHPGAVILALSGWIDISCVGELQRLLDAAFAQDEVRSVAIDFSDAEYIDSAIVSALIRAKSTGDECDKGFALLSLASQVWRVLTETHLIDVFDVFPSSEQFLDWHQESAPGDEGTPLPS